MIETATNTVSATVPVGAGPGGVSVAPDGSRVYVAGQNDNTVSVIDPATGTVTGSVPVGATPVGVLADPAGGAVYVANSQGGTLSVIDPATGTVTRTVATGSGPYALATAPVAPTVTGVRPGHGPGAGGNTVTVTGTHLAGALDVRFGGAPASGVTVLDDGTLEATAPPGTAGPVDVTVTTPAGTGPRSVAGRYTYEYPFSGFRPPVADPPAVNRANAGRTVPVEFALGGDFGPDVIARDSPAVTPVDCTTGTPLAPPAPATAAGSGAPSFEADARGYRFRWQTDPSYAGSCRLFTVGLTDGTQHTALFRFH
ncbi:PxKF domain-containing protein [Kitasatospora saccharophila]|uniref:PxKF domain-containing protein n=1 Tax=Kitasatospora saccharophila TaxID=407973 RepID=UPI003626D37E